MVDERERVPVRTIAAIIAMVLLTGFAVVLLIRLHRALTWIVIAAFLAVIANTAVRGVERRLHLGRGPATALVFVLGTVAVAALAALFIRPLARQAGEFADQLPHYVEQARSGHGPIGELIVRFKLDKKIAENQQQLQESLTGLGKPALTVLQGIASTLVGALVVLILAIFMTLEGPMLIRRTLALVPERHRRRVATVTEDCGRAVTGYITGQLLIAVLCGVTTYIILLVLDVPFRGTVALFVALTDLIPLVGATIGAVVAVIVALLASTTDGIVVAVWFIIYQQAENHLLQPVVQSRTVKLDPLAVLVAVIVGVELAGILGALLAIPVAGMISVVVRDVWGRRRGRDAGLSADRLAGPEPSAQPPP